MGLTKKTNRELSSALLAEPHGEHVNRFLLTVRSSNTSHKRLQLQGASQAQVAAKAASFGFQVLSVQRIHRQKASRPICRLRAPSFPLLLFSQELLALLEAGLNLSECIEVLHSKESSPHARAQLASVLSSLSEGKSFSDALGEAPEHFPPIYTATVRAAERSGHLPLALERFILYQTQLDVLRKRLVSASVYPCALLVIGCLVTLFLLGYVVPRFSAVFDSSQRDLPWLSAALIATGRTFNDHWEWVVLGGAVVLGSLVFAVIRWRRQVGHAILSAPWLSQRAHEFQMARFYHAVSLLLGAGVPLASALGMTKDLLGPKLKSTLDNTREAVEQGQSFSAALSKCNLLDPVSASLIKVGEKSGQLAEMLHRTARFADDEFARRIDWASRLLEPLLMVALGIVIGTVVVLLYLPIFELAGSMQ